MTCLLSMPNLLHALIFCGALCAQAGIGVTTIRQPGAALDPSLRNEADHATRQAAAWLAARQQPDGAWGSADRTRLTSLALLALAVSRPQQHSDACARAALWLDAPPALTNDALGTHAWRLIALAQFLPDTPARTNLLRRFAQTAQPLGAETSDATPGDRRLWREALFLAGLGSEPPAPDAHDRESLSRLAQAWPPVAADPEFAWHCARLINRAGAGQLTRGGAPLDWRRDLAQHLINTQRRATDKGGYWEAPCADAKIRATAFGLLTLQEL